LAPGETKEFVVEERREVGEMVYLANEDETRLRFFAAGPYLSEKTRAFLAGVGDLMAQKSAQHRLINEAQGRCAASPRRRSGCGGTSAQ
jgi:hypothetical protein